MNLQSYRLRNFRRLENVLVDIITNSQKNNEIRNDISPIIISRNLQFLILSSFISNLYSKKPKDFQHSIEQTLELFLNGANVQE